MVMSARGDGFMLFKKKPEAATPAKGAAPGTPGSPATPVDPGGGKPVAGEEHRDLRKANRFFEHAKTVADARNYDYAIDCYINGLRHAPDSLQHHEALREVALRRKVNGGAPPGMMEKFKHSGGKTVIDKMLNAEYLWAKDPLDPENALAVMEHAVAGNLDEIGYWAGQFVLDQTQAAKKPGKGVYLKARDLFKKIHSFERAVEAHRRVMAMEPTNMALLQELKNLEAEVAIRRANLKQDGTFRDSIKDADKQAAIQQENTLAATDDSLIEIILRCREEYQAKPDNIDLLLKLVRALTQKEDDDRENEAIELLLDGYQRFQQFRMKEQAGQIRIKQMTRQIRNLKAAIPGETNTPRKEQMEASLKRHTEDLMKFELAEYAERCRNYPTDMNLKYRLGRLQLAAGDVDSALASLQEAATDPKNKAVALRYLGECFARKEWHDQAIDIYRRAIEVHPLSDDKLGMELRYELSRALENKGRTDRHLPSAEEAARIAGNIVLADFNYRDIRQRVDVIRKLVEELRKGA
jgi:tetratricopeptide (TPR) repeat protein